VGSWPGGPWARSKWWLVGSRARYRYCSSSDHFRKSLVFLIFLLKFCKSFGNLSCNKVEISGHFLCSILVCYVLCIAASVIISRNDPVYN
jgi:hypothetical protein